MRKYQHKIRKKLGLNKWKYTKAISDWFPGIQNKKKAAFIQFDIIHFCPFITDNILNEAIQIAQQHAQTLDDERKINTA